MSFSPLSNEKAVFEQLKKEPPATEQAIIAMLNGVATNLPQDYLDFLRTTNGATGIGPDIWVNIAPAEEVVETTLGYGAFKYAPGLILVGTDGLGNVLGIDVRSGDTKSMRYVRLDPVWLELDTGSVQNNCDSFFALLREIANE